MLSPSFNLDDLLAKYMEMLQEDVYDNSTSTSYDGDTSDYTDTEGSVSSFNDVEYVQPNNVNPISSSTPGWVEETSMNPDDYRPVPRCDAPIRAQVIGLGLGMEHSNSMCVALVYFRMWSTALTHFPVAKKRPCFFYNPSIQCR